MKNVFQAALVFFALSSLSAQASTCIVEYNPAQNKKVGVLDRLNPRKRNEAAKAQLEFYLAEVKKSSCYRASLIASECPLGKDSMEVSLYRAALMACDQELESSIAGKFKDKKKQEQELGTAMAARTACNEEYDHELDKLMCQIDLSYGQIRSINPQSESVRDSNKH